MPGASAITESLSQISAFVETGKHENITKESENANERVREKERTREKERETVIFTVCFFFDNF